jgi:hypothetical protein
MRRMIGASSSANGSSLIRVACLARAPVADLEVQITTAQFECGYPSAERRA